MRTITATRVSIADKIETKNAGAVGGILFRLRYSALAALCDACRNILAVNDKISNISRTRAAID
eukprot:1192019-Prorocentrum_minimum.AAC.2